MFISPEKYGGISIKKNFRSILLFFMANLTFTHCNGNKTNLKVTVIDRAIIYYFLINLSFEKTAQ